MKTVGFDVLDEDIAPNQINISSLVLKKELNPLIWDNNYLREDIKNVLCPIIDEYYSYVTKDLDEVKVIDVYFTGSLANYNWSTYSDVDIHIVSDYSKINSDVEFVSKYFKDRSELYSLKHQHCLGNFDVELNMNDIVPLRKNAGVWSMLDDIWIQEPNIHEINIDYPLIKEKSAKIMNLIDNNINNPDVLKIIKKKISKMRNSSLDSEGEFANENLVFKLLRRSGYIDKLKRLINKPQ